MSRWLAGKCTANTAMMRLLAGKWGASEPESIQIKNSRGETAAVWSCVLVCIASERHGLHGDDDENFLGRVEDF